MRRKQRNNRARVVMLVMRVWAMMSIRMMRIGYEVPVWQWHGRGAMSVEVMVSIDVHWVGNRRHQDTSWDRDLRKGGR